MSQGFGQRSGTTREGLRSVQGVKFERTIDSDEASAGASKLRKMVFWIGAAALMLGIYIGTRNSGPGLLARFGTKSAPAAQPYVPVEAKDVLLEQVNRDCRTKGDAARKSGDGVMLRQSAAYLACLATDKPLRLCQLAHRTHLLAAVRNYYGLQVKMREGRVSTDPQVVEAFKAVIVNGYVPRRDIVSAAGQSDLETALRGIEARKSGCGG